MIFPLLPAFLTGTLGASATALGAIEGAAESVSSLFKVASGWVSDRLGRRKELALLGYGLAALTRPLVSLATLPAHVLAIRITDRFGKGLRTPPRDALLADSVDRDSLGRTFGFHRAMDHAGAILGPLVAAVLLGSAGLPLRTVFALAAIPGVLSLILLARGVTDIPPGGSAGIRPGSPAGASSGVTEGGSAGGPASARRSRRDFHVFLGIVFLFTLGNSSDAFLLLRAQKLGIPLASLPLLWILLHVVKSALSTPAGALSDRFGRKGAIAAGWLLYAVVYAGLGTAGSAAAVWGWVAVYGIFFALTEGAEKALVAELVPPGERGRAYGLFHGAVGIGALPASLLMGLLWDRFGPGIAFGFGAALALAAAALLVLLVRAPRAEAPEV